MSESVSENLSWVHPDVLSELRSHGRFAPATTPVVSSFIDAAEELLGGVSSAIVPKDCVDDIDAYGFEPARLALRLGSKAVFRDQSTRNSLRLNEYDTYYRVSLDHFNPEQGRLVEHAIADKFHYVVGGCALVGGAYWALTRRD